jgi:hypothetical protein
MRHMESEGLPINISGHIEWGGVDGQLEIRTFSLGREILQRQPEEMLPNMGTLLKMVPLA